MTRSWPVSSGSRKAMPTSDSVKLRRNSLPSAVIRSSSIVLRWTAMPSGSTSRAAQAR